MSIIKSSSSKIASKEWYTKIKKNNVYIVFIIFTMTFSSTILPDLPSVIFPLDSLSVIREAAAQEEEEVERETSEGGGGEDEDSDPDSDQQNLEAKAQGQEGGGGKGEGETTEQESSSEEQPEEEPGCSQ